MSSLEKTLLLCLCLGIIGSSSSTISITNNKYNDIVVAINPNIPENVTLINCIKEMFTVASLTLYRATRQRASFGNIEILVPRTWTNGTYEIATGRSYGTGDFLISSQTKQPTTIQYGSCGAPGDKILLPKQWPDNNDFFCSRGSTMLYNAKVIVLEYARYRYGVFEEYDDSQRFYFNSTGYLEASRCSASLSPYLLTARNNMIVKPSCVQDQTTRMYNSDCIAIYHGGSLQGNQNLTASMMFQPSLYLTTTFCHNDSNDPSNLHNKEAPNVHNRLCNQRSVWEVIMTSPDFASGLNEPNSSLDTIPNFRVVIPESTRIVLVLDSSGSMDLNQRITKMGQIVESFVQDKVPSSTQVAIVDFDHLAKIVRHLTFPNTQANKDTIISAIPTSADGGTNIGGGILKAIEALESGGASAAGGVIVVLTDGRDSGSIRPISPKVTTKGVVVHAIFFALTALVNSELVDLANSTGGSTYIGDDNNILSAFGAFDALAQTQDGNLFDQVSEISSVSFTGTVHNETVYIDSSIGNETVFTVSWLSSSNPVLTITDPTGCVSSSTVSPSSCPQPITFNSGISQTLRATVSGTAMAGKWVYKIMSTATDTFTALVSSKASDVNVAPITVETSIQSTAITTTTPLAIYARVSRNSLPVLGASVIGIIEIPGVDDKFERILLDNGGGADIMKSDGIYSAYFTNFSSTGRYSLQVKVSGGNFSVVGSNARSSTKTTRLTFIPVLLPNGTVIPGTIDGISTAKLDDFTRIVTSPSFTYSGTPITPGTDPFPPASVTDLAATQVNVTDPSSGIKLSFTAPGDDADTGTASSYQIQYVNSPDELDPTFANASTLINASLVSSPKAAGMTEEITVYIPDYPQTPVVIIALAMRAVDDAGNAGAVSNRVVVNYFLEPPRILATTPSPPTTNTSNTIPIVDATKGDMKTTYIIIGVTFGGTILVLVILGIFIYCKVVRRWNSAKLESHSEFQGHIYSCEIPHAKAPTYENSTNIYS